MRRLIFPFFNAIAAGMLLIGAAWADLDSGISAYASGDFDAAAREFAVLAGKGDMEGQYYLGLLYEEGQGLPKSYDEAVAHYAQAAKQGYLDAYFALGEIYLSRFAPQKDRISAYIWLEMAAKHGHPRGRDEFERNKQAMTSEEIAQAAKRSIADR